MKELNEAEIAKAYAGKPYNIDHLRKVAMGSGDSGAIVYYGHLSKKYHELFGITETLANEWLHNRIFFSVVMELDEEAGVIEICRVYKANSETKFPLTQQELEIFKRIMEYITTEKEI